MALEDPTDTPYQRQRTAAFNAESKKHAQAALEQFRAAKGRALKLVAGEQTTKRKAIDSLRRIYDKLSAGYLRTPMTTYAVWCELVKPEWDEVCAAACDDAVWDRLVETYEERDHG